MIAFYDKWQVENYEAERVLGLTRVVSRLGDVLQPQHMHVSELSAARRPAARAD